MLDANDPTTRMALARVGQTLRGKWRLDALLGVGGMACVFAATHRNGSRGAVKLLHREQALDAATRERFLREGYVANRVAHPGVVAILDDDVTEDQSVYLVMELLEGETLGARAAAYPGRRLPVPEALDAADQLLDVLAAAHAKGIVHRDIKPDNLFWTRDRRLKVLDFGIARMHEVSGASERTQTGAVFGTPAYMPPEQALGETAAINALTDLWAAGATLFTLLSGRKVREDKTANRVLLAAMTQPAPPLAGVAPDLPPALAAIVDRSLAFDQSGRFPDAATMQRALRDFAAMPEKTAMGLGAAPPPAPVALGAPPSGADPVTVAIPPPRRPLRQRTEPLAQPVQAVQPVQPAQFGQPGAPPVPRDARPEPARPPAGRGWLIAGGALVATLATGLAAYAVLRPPPAPPEPTSVAATSVAPTPGASTSVAATSVAPTPMASTPVAPTPVTATSVTATSVTPTPVAPTSVPASPGPTGNVPASRPAKGKGSKKDPWAVF